MFSIDSRQTKIWSIDIYPRIHKNEYVDKLRAAEKKKEADHKSKAVNKPEVKVVACYLA